MADGIQIPSPSAFLRHSPPPRSSSTINPPSSASNRPPNTRRPTSAEVVGKQKAATALPRKPGAAPVGVDKIKQSKSRNGCATCKAKRLKCDEEKPGCRQCQKRNVVCGGYNKEFKWRPFEETNVKVQIDRQHHILGHVRGKSRSAETSKPTTPTTEQPPILTNGHGILTDEQRKKDSFIGDGEHLVSAALEQARAAVRLSHSPQGRPSTTSPIERLPPPLPPPSGSPPPLPTPRPPTSSNNNNNNENNRKRSSMHDDRPDAGSVPRLSPRSGSPIIAELLGPFHPNRQDNSDDGDMNVNLDMPSPDDVTLDHDMINGDLTDEDMELLLRGLHPPQSLPTSPMAQHINMSDNLGLQDLTLRSRDFSSFGQGPPSPSDSGLDALLWRFIHVTSAVRSVIDGPNENPWRTLVLPLARESPALTHALAAMAAFHAAFDYDHMNVVGQQHKHASLKYLQEGLREGNMTEEAAIATALALGISHTWEVSTASGNAHIKGAQALVRNALENHRRRPLEGDALLLLKFLCNAWVYMDVIARLTAVDSDESNDFDSTFLFLPGSPNMVDDEDNGFGINFGMPVDARLDPLMGCANTLFPLIGRVANLVRKVCRSMNNSPSIISQARDLKRLLEIWDPPAAVDEPEDPETEIEHCVQTAEAYRWATLLHLHQSVPELPSETSAELAHRVLTILATIPPESRTTIVQTYPLMVAGCEAAASSPNNNNSVSNGGGLIDDAESDRQWVRERWARVQARMHIGVLDRCAIVTEEVWRRRDTYENTPSTRRKLVATADLQPVRRNTQPLVRTDTGSFGGDPGRMGVVYSCLDATMGGDYDRIPGFNHGGPGTGGKSGGPGPGGSSSRDGSAGPASSKAGGHHSVGKNPGDGKARDSRRPTIRHANSIDPAYTVRGHLHWVGVMWDWGWEVLLG